MTDKPSSTVNFRKLLLNRCQKEFEKDKVDDDAFEKKHRELEAAASVSPQNRSQLQNLENDFRITLFCLLFWLAVLLD